MKLREVADVIALDQRGTGLSNQLPDCPKWSRFSPARSYTKEDYVNRTNQAIPKCLTYWKSKKVSLEGYNTSESAQDIEALRKALKAEKISLWGISYGSHLAFEYIRLFEDNIDRVVLASLEGPNETIKLPRSTENFLFKIAELAEDNYGSKTKYKGLKDKIIAVHERAEEKPIRTRYTPESGETFQTRISNFELQWAIAAFFLKNPSDSKKLPKLYTQMYDGNFSGITPYVIGLRQYLSRGVPPMTLAMDLQSGISKRRKDQVKNQINKAILGSTINNLLFEWMEAGHLKPLPISFRTLRRNSVSALFLSGTLDGRTYVKDARRTAVYFKNGKHVIIENAGHDLFMSSPKVNQLVVDYFKGKKVEVKKIELKPTLFD